MTVTSTELKIRFAYVAGSVILTAILAILIVSVMRPTTARDSPVTVRGGSVVGYSPVVWTNLQNNPPIYQSKAIGTTMTLNEIYDVKLPGGSPLEDIPLNIANNWKIRLTFRHFGGVQEDTTKVLWVCSQLDTNGNCSLDDSRALADTVYLVGDGNGDFTDDTVDKPGYRYDLKTCDKSTDPRTSRCNHIHSV